MSARPLSCVELKLWVRGVTCVAKLSIEEILSLPKNFF